MSTIVDNVITNPSGGSSGGGPAWLDTRRTAAKAVSATINSEWYTDFASSSDWGTSNTGAGTAVANTALGGGVVTVTGQTANSVYVFPVGKPPLIADLATSKFYAYWRVRFTGPSGANAQLFCIVISPNALDSQFSVGIDGTFQAGGSNANLVTRVYDTVTNTVAVGAVAIDTASYHDVEMSSDGTTVTCKVDGVLVATIVASLVGASKLGTIGFTAFSNDATARVAQIDKMYLGFVGQ
jgi:hypothetical protein